MRKKKRAITVKLLDRLWSLVVRKRDRFRCQVCGETDYRKIQAMHIISRSEWAVRWNLDNGISGCRACHKYFTHRPVAWENWLMSDKNRKKTFQRLKKIVSMWYNSNCPKIDRATILEELNGKDKR